VFLYFLPSENFPLSYLQAQFSFPSQVQEMYPANVHVHVTFLANFEHEICEMGAKYSCSLQKYITCVATGTDAILSIYKDENFFWLLKLHGQGCVLFETCAVMTWLSSI
jgi:hypothetical protein